MLAVRLVAVSVEVTLITSVAVVQLSAEYCHFTTVPVMPDKVSVVLLVPEQTVALPAILPPTETGSTVICITLDSAAASQLSMQSTRETRLNQVVAVKFSGAKEAELLEAISVNPEELLIADCSHLYCSVPVCPLGATMLVNASGTKPEQIV